MAKRPLSTNDLLLGVSYVLTHPNLQVWLIFKSELTHCRWRSPLFLFNDLIPRSHFRSGTHT